MDGEELDRALERALAVANAWVKKPRLEQLLGKLLSASDILAGRGWTVPARALPVQVMEAAADPDEWFARFYDTLRLGVLEVFLHTELAEWQPLVDQTLGAFRRGEHAMVLCSGLVILESVSARATLRRDTAVKGLMSQRLEVSETAWGSAHKNVLAWSLDAALPRLRPSGDHTRVWTLEGRDSPAGWTREDAVRVLNALGTAAVLLPPRITRDMPASISFGPTPAQARDTSL